MPFGRSARLGGNLAGRHLDMGSPPRGQEPLNFGSFWSLFGRLVARLGREKAHAEVVIIMHDGCISQVRVNRSYLPNTLPEVD